eukprot:2382401-Prymnesium_polylepis.1
MVHTSPSLLLPKKNPAPKSLRVSGSDGLPLLPRCRRRPSCAGYATKWRLHAITGESATWGTRLSTDSPIHFRSRAAVTKKTTKVVHKMVVPVSPAQRPPSRLARSGQVA